MGLCCVPSSTATYGNVDTTAPFAKCFNLFYTLHDTDGCWIEAVAPLQIYYNHYILFASR